MYLKSKLVDLLFISENYVAFEPVCLKLLSFAIACSSFHPIHCIFKMM